MTSEHVSEIGKITTAICEINTDMFNINKKIIELKVNLLKSHHTFTEDEIIQTYKKIENNSNAIDFLHNSHRILNQVITSMRDYKCNHDRIQDDSNFDISHTCYVCSKCGMIM